MDQLIARGVVVLPFLSNSGGADTRFFISAATFSPPELSDNKWPFALGGFQALGFASGFHNELSRELRRRADAVLRPLLAAALLPHHRLAHLQQLADRLLIREPGAKVTAESYHRDSPAGNQVAPEEGDYFLGGWVNLDSAGEQQFICVPGTHAGVAVPRGGFAKITDRRELDSYKEREEVIRIPPGHVVIFYTHLVHRVANAVRRDSAMRRLFIGWRLTNSARPLVPALERLLDEQAVIPLPSGQIPPLYPAMYLANLDQNWKRLHEYSRRLHPHLTQHREVGKAQFLRGATGGIRRIRIPVRFALPLRRLAVEVSSDDETPAEYPPLLPEELSLAYPAYTPEDKHVLLRNK
jgi:hypothetical protein